MDNKTSTRTESVGTTILYDGMGDLSLHSKDGQVREWVGVPSPTFDDVMATVELEEGLTTLHSPPEQQFSVRECEGEKEIEITLQER